MSDRPEPIDRLQFEARRLVQEHPPRWRHRNKVIVHEIACPPGIGASGPARIYPLGGDAFARERRHPIRHEPAGGPARILDYAPALDRTDALEWHVNFADPVLFVAYGSSLFAQDEMQVAEHPALGSLKEALDAGTFVRRPWIGTSRRRSW